MRRLIFWGAGIVFVSLIALLVFVRGSGISAKREPWPIEERVATAAWRFLIPANARDAVNPVAATPETLREALEHFADHCAVCHANDGSGNATIGRRIFPPAPDMRAARTQSLTDGELFYAIEHGIPWTAMPAWETGTPEGEQDSWKLVTFIRHLPALTPAELSDMEKLNPKSPAELTGDRGDPAPKKGRHIHK
jgi:mono/diheme cytochrome c family protein